MKILVIDDDHMVRYALSRILQRSGYDVVTASDGKRGMMLVREELPDVVITDIIMPEQEGIETISLLRHQYPQMKIIAISGGGRIRNVDFLEMARSLGADDVISKPFEADELLGRLRRVMSVDPEVERIHWGIASNTPSPLRSFDAAVAASISL